MRIEKVDNLAEAQQFLNKYYILRGIYYKPLDKQIRQVFVGMPDKGISSMWYKRNEFNFIASDLDNLFLWAAFTDGEIIPIAELYNDIELVEIINRGNLLYQIEPINNEWTEPIKIPKGLDIIVRYKAKGRLNVKIIDSASLDTKDKSRYEIENSERLNVFYRPELMDLVNPVIVLQLVDNEDNVADISIEFTEIN